MTKHFDEIPVRQNISIKMSYIQSNISIQVNNAILSALQIALRAGVLSIFEYSENRESNKNRFSVFILRISRSFFLLPHTLTRSF